MSGLHVKVDAILNIHRDTVALYVGKPLAEFHEGVKQAREHYLISRPQDAEVIVANAKVNEPPFSRHSLYCPTRVAPLS